MNGLTGDDKDQLEALLKDMLGPKGDIDNPDDVVYA